MPYLKHDTTRLQQERHALSAQQAPLTAQLATQQQAVTAAQAQRTSAVNAVAQAQAGLAPLRTAAAAADAHVADLEQDIQDASEPPQGGPTSAWKQRLAALQRQLTQAQAAAEAAHNRLDAAQQSVLQAQAQVQAADRQVAAAAAAVQATQTIIAGLQTRQRETEQRLAEIDRWETDIARDPLVRPSLEQTASELSARVAALEETLLTTRFELEDAETLLARLTARREQVAGRLTTLTSQLPGAEAELATAQQAAAAAEEQVTTHLQDGP